MKSVTINAPVPSASSSALSSPSWDNRTRFVVGGMVFLFLVSWGMVMGRLIGSKFWDAQHNIQVMDEMLADKETPEMMKKIINGSFMPYYTSRYVLFFPHVCGSILWWNLYFFQLIPSVRRKYKKAHRVSGRVLMVCALAQTISGIGLAFKGPSPTIKLVSVFLALSIVYCVYYAWYYAAIEKNIAKHKYWAMRLVGYMQTIALQRCWLPVLLACHKFGWPSSCYFLNLYLYPPFDENDLATAIQIFDDSFVCAFITGAYLTEWYLAAYYGWTDTQPQQAKATKSQ